MNWWFLARKLQLCRFQSRFFLPSSKLNSNNNFARFARNIAKMRLFKSNFEPKYTSSFACFTGFPISKESYLCLMRTSRCRDCYCSSHFYSIFSLIALCSGCIEYKLVVFGLLFFHAVNVELMFIILFFFFFIHIIMYRKLVCNVWQRQPGKQKRKRWIISASLCL